MSRLIAIVEDEAALRDNYREHLSKQGYKVEIDDSSMIGQCVDEYRALATLRSFEESGIQGRNLCRPSICCCCFQNRLTGPGNTRYWPG